MKHVGSKSQTVMDFTVSERNETLGVNGMPSREDSQPIPSTWLDDELQLAEKESLYLTTALEGLTSSGQEDAPTKVKARIIACCTKEMTNALLFKDVAIQRHMEDFETEILKRSRQQSKKSWPCLHMHLFVSSTMC